MIKNKIKGLLKSEGISQNEVATRWNYTKQSFSNKIRMERFTIQELIDLAEMTGTRVAFISKKGGDIVTIFNYDDLG